MSIAPWAGFTIPASWFQSVDPLIFLLTLVAVAFWLRQAKRGNEPHAVGKMALGVLGLCCAFLLLAAIAASEGGKPH